MFRVGDKIVYPLYGAGVIEGMEQKEVDGSSQMYYIMRIPVGNLKIMISANMANTLGMRAVYGKDEILKVIGSVSEEPLDMPENWNQRYKENMEKIKSGKLNEVALVYRNLLKRESRRGLSSAEKKVLTIAKQIILSELILSQDVERDVAEEMLTTVFKNAVAN